MPAIGTHQSELVRLRADNARLMTELKKCAMVIEKLEDYDALKARIAELEAERQGVALALAHYERIKKIVDAALQ